MVGCPSYSENVMGASMCHWQKSQFAWHWFLPRLILFGLVYLLLKPGIIPKVSVIASVRLDTWKDHSHLGKHSLHGHRHRWPQPQHQLWRFPWLDRVSSGSAYHQRSLSPVITSVRLKDHASFFYYPVTLGAHSHQLPIFLFAADIWHNNYTVLLKRSKMTGTCLKLSPFATQQIHS